MKTTHLPNPHLDSVSTTSLPPQWSWLRSLLSRSYLLAVLLSCVAFLPAASTAQAAPTASCPTATSDIVLAGAAKADVSPQQPVYLGGYGIGPTRLSTGVQQPLYVRALAIRSTDEQPAHTLVFVALDSQGYFAAYQDGPYGLDDVRNTIANQLGIPFGNIVISSTHSHSGPDGIGFWGGLPDSYLSFVHDQAINAITQAVSNLATARLSIGTTSIAGYTRTFSNGSWPTDTELRVLQAVSSNNGQVISTLLNASVHPTILQASNTLASPDWPGVTATQLDTQLGGTTVVMVGALGHTWPATASLPSDQYQALQAYGSIITGKALAAIGSAQPISQPTLCASAQTFQETDTTSPLLLGLQNNNIPGVHVMRSRQAPYYTSPNIVQVETETLRIGPIVFFAAPVEAYPSLLFLLRGQVHASTDFFFGLANDQLGYATPWWEYPGAVLNSPSDEALFIIAPDFGNTIVQHLASGAHEIGL